MHAIGVILVGFEFVHDFRVGDFLAPSEGDVLIVDDEESVGALDARACDGGRGADAASQEAAFITCGLVPWAL